MKRIDKANWNGQSPMLTCPTVHYEPAEKTQAIAAGGMGVAQQMVRQLGIAHSINRGCPIFKFHLPYSEADHVLNIAFNLFAGGTCLEHLELRRNDEAYLDALGAQRIPDPTTAGDFCRRFSEGQIQNLLDALHEPQKLFDDWPYFFYITNLPKKVTPQKVVAESNRRCDQENIIAQGKAMGALSAPLNDLAGNWAYMVLAMPAWNLKCRLSLSIRGTGNAKACEKRRVQKQRLLRMDLSTFRQSVIQIPAQILNSGRRLIYRILTWTPSLEIIFCLHESINRPLRT